LRRLYACPLKTNGQTLSILISASEGAISGCAGQTAARQVNPNKRTPELEQTYLAVRHPLAG
jgi:hypothetical protein